MPDVWIPIGKAAAMLGITREWLRQKAEEWGFSVRRNPSGRRYLKLSEVLEAGGSYELFEKIRDREKEKRRRKRLEKFRREIEERKKGKGNGPERVVKLVAR